MLAFLKNFWRPKMSTPLTPSQQSQALLAAAGQAAAADQAAGATVQADSGSIANLNTQLATAAQQLATDQQAAASADAASNAAFIAFAQSLAGDFGIPLPVTIPAVVQPAATKS